MSERSRSSRRTAPDRDRAAVEHLRTGLKDGRPWPSSLLEAMALWSTPEETYRGRTYSYFIAGEAFDWLLLAERLCVAVDSLVPQPEQEELLLHGRFPPSFDKTRFKDLLGVEKYRGYLNYYYGVTVEEALQLATELEVHKRYASNGVQYRDDYFEEAYVKIYGTARSELLERFRAETGLATKRTMSLSESKKFTYWLFQHRLEESDKAKIASDTKKGLMQLQRMRESPRASAGPDYLAPTLQLESPKEYRLSPRETDAELTGKRSGPSRRS